MHIRFEDAETPLNLQARIPDEILVAYQGHRRELSFQLWCEDRRRRYQRKPQ